MKTLFLISFMLNSLLGMSQEGKPFYISGSLKNFSSPAEKVFLSYKAGEKNLRDSAQVIDGKYYFSGYLQEGVPARLNLVLLPGADGKRIRGFRNQLEFFLSPDKYTITSVDTFYNAAITGSKANEDFMKLNALLEPYQKIRNSQFGNEYFKAMDAKDIEGMKGPKAKMDSMDMIIQNIYGDFVKNNRKSEIAVYAVAQFAGTDIDANKVEPVFKLLSKNQRETPAAIALNEKIQVARKTGIGVVLSDFTQNDTLGNPVSFSAFRGKYLFVDFWASWCVPCRWENPDIVKAWNAFKNKGFQIIGVALERDKDKDKWLKAIHDDKLTWTHVSDLKYWDNAIAKELGIGFVPQNLLLDPQGKIIAKNLTGDALQKKLGEILQ